MTYANCVLRIALFRYQLNPRYCELSKKVSIFTVCCDIRVGIEVSYFSNLIKLLSYFTPSVSTRFCNIPPVVFYSTYIVHLRSQSAHIAQQNSSVKEAQKCLNILATLYFCAKLSALHQSLIEKL